MKKCVLNFLFIFLFAYNLYSQVVVPDAIREYVVIQPVYENANSFVNNLAPVWQNRKWGYIDKTGKTVIPFKYDYADAFSCNLALVKANNTIRYINTEGSFAFAQLLTKAFGFSENLAAAITTGNSYGFIDKSGKTVIEQKFEWTKSFSQELAPVKENGKWGFIDKKGKYIIANLFDNAQIFSENLAAVELNGKWGFINKNAKMIINPDYDYALNFQEGLCAVSKNGLYGFINSKGNDIVDYQFEDALNFSEGLAPAMKSGKWGYIDKSGKWIIEPVLDQAGIFSEGMAYFIIMANNKSYAGFIKNPLSKEDVEDKQNNNTIEEIDNETEKEDQSNIEQETPDSDVIKYIPCGEYQSGWQGKITKIHKLNSDTKTVSINWEVLNNPYSIIMYSGKGISKKEIFELKNIEYSGYKKVTIPQNVELITIIISAKKKETQWRYVISCE